MRHKALVALGCLLLAVMLAACTGETGPQGDAGSSGPQGEAGEIGKTGPQGERGPNNNQPFGNSGSVGVAKSDLDSDGGPEQPTSQPPRFPLNKPKYPRLDSTLNKLVGQIGSQSTADIASSAPISTGDLVAVTVRLSHNSSSTVDFLESVGAIVANVGTNYIEAYTPVTFLAPLSERDGVLRIQAIIPSEPAVTDN
jgi:hypothetical protein